MDDIDFNYFNCIKSLLFVQLISDMFPHPLKTLSVMSPIDVLQHPELAASIQCKR